MREVTETPSGEPLEEQSRALDVRRAKGHDRLREERRVAGTVDHGADPVPEPTGGGPGETASRRAQVALDDLDSARRHRPDRPRHPRRRRVVSSRARQRDHRPSSHAQTPSHLPADEAGYPGDKNAVGRGRR